MAGATRRPVRAGGWESVLASVAWGVIWIHERARQARASDQGDGEGFAACFAQDGVFVSSRLGEISGPDALADFARAGGARANLNCAG